MDVQQIKKEIVEGKGYVLIPDLLSKEEAAEARTTVLNLLEKDRQKGKLFTHENSERLYGLVHKSPIFEKMVQKEKIIQVMKSILGDDMILSVCSSHVLNPGKGMTRHVDYPYSVMEQPFPPSPIMGIQVIWMLEDFTEENGAPRFFPGSQKFCKKPNHDQQYFDDNAEILAGKSGSAIISHCLCWHGTGDNSTDQPRVAVLTHYAPLFVRPFKDPLLDKQDDVLERTKTNPTLKTLLGLNFETDVRERHRIPHG